MRKIFTLIFVAALTVTTLYGCGVVVESNNESGANCDVEYGRFTEEYYTNNIGVITDTQTGNQYLLYRSANGTGLTMMDTED